MALRRSTRARFASIDTSGTKNTSTPSTSAKASANHGENSPSAITASAYTSHATTVGNTARRYRFCRCPMSSASSPRMSPVRWLRRKNTASPSSVSYSLRRRLLVMRSTQSWLVRRSRYCRMGLLMPKMRTKSVGRCTMRMLPGISAAALMRKPDVTMSPLANPNVATPRNSASASAFQ